MADTHWQAYLLGYLYGAGSVLLLIGIRKLLHSAETTDEM